MHHRFVAKVCAALAAAVVMLPAANASADETNPAVIACKGKAEGDACTVQRPIKNNEGQHDTRGTPGTCQTDECCELDYSKGSPPETNCGPCLSCKEGLPAPTPDAPAVTASADGGAGEPPRSETQPPPNPPNDKRGCAVAGSAARGAGLGWSALAWAGIVLLRRRRVANDYDPQ